MNIYYPDKTKDPNYEYSLLIYPIYDVQLTVHSSTDKLYGGLNNWIKVLNENFKGYTHTLPTFTTISSSELDILYDPIEDIPDNVIKDSKEKAEKLLNEKFHYENYHYIFMSGMVSNYDHEYILINVPNSIYEMVKAKENLESL